MKADIDTTADALGRKRIIDDWSKGLVTAKEGKSGQFGNWKGITLVSTAAKAIGKEDIKRISWTDDKKLTKEHAGFRNPKSTMEQIFVLKNII